MRTLAKIAFVGFMLYLVVTGNANTPSSLSKQQKVTFQKALDSKMIKSLAICKGGLELNLLLTNLLKDSVSIAIPAGWRFASNDKQNDYQDILVTHEEIIVLSPKQAKKCDIKGYCCEYSKSGPIKGIAYTNGKMADNNLVQVAQFLNTHPIDKNTEQYSVWAVSDYKETANITAPNDSLATVLRYFVAGVKGEPVPWYTLLKRGNVSQSGTINDKPIRFKAVINPTVAKKCYSYCYIKDKKGTIVSKIQGSWLYPESKEISTDFNVVNLKKGDYTLVMESDKNALFKREFKI